LATADVRYVTFAVWSVAPSAPRSAAKEMQMADVTTRLARAAADWIRVHIRELPEEQQRLVGEYVIGDYKEVVLTIQIASGEVSLTLVDQHGGRELLRTRTPMVNIVVPPDGQVH